MRIKRGCGDEPHPWFFISNKRLFRNSLYQPFRLLASGGPTFGRPKVGRKTAGETPDPHFCPIGRHQGRCTVATEFLPGRWSLVIGAVSILLRLSPLGMRDGSECILAPARTTLSQLLYIAPLFYSIDDGSQGDAHSPLLSCSFLSPPPAKVRSLKWESLS